MEREKKKTTVPDIVREVPREYQRISEGVSKMYWINVILTGLVVIFTGSVAIFTGLY